MHWTVWAYVAIVAMLVVRGVLITRMGIAEQADRVYFVSIAIGVMCLVTGLGIVLAVSAQVFRL